MKKELTIYQAKDGAIKLKLDAKTETIWATRMQMAAIFGVNPQAILKHLQNIFTQGELQKRQLFPKWN